MEERTCRECGHRFTFDPARFGGRFKLPALCLECHRARRERLVAMQGTVVRVGSAFAVATIKGSSGEFFFWRFGAGRPKVGDRVQFARDPEEVARGGRLPLARRARLIA